MGRIYIPRWAYRKPCTPNRIRRLIMIEPSSLSSDLGGWPVAGKLMAHEARKYLLGSTGQRVRRKIISVGKHLEPENVYLLPMAAERAVCLRIGHRSRNHTGVADFFRPQR